MGIQWFTFAAQVVNFLVLLALLHRFLYRPLTRAMERRRREIEERLEEGERMQRQARQREERLEEERRELEHRRREVLAEADEEAESRRRELVEEARREADERRRRWRRAVERERETFLDELRRRAADEALEVARKTLDDLAGADLEATAVDRFAGRLEELDGADRERLAEAVEESAGRQGEGPRVTTAFELGDGELRRLREALERALDGSLPEERELRFVTDREVGFGVRLDAGGFELAWSVDRYLGELRRRVGELLERAGDGGEEEGGDSRGGEGR